MTNRLKNKITIEDYFAADDIHDVAQEADGGAVTCLVAAVTLCVEGLLVYWAVRSELSPWVVLILHAAVSTILAVYAKAVRFTGRENRFAYLLFLATASTGPYGAAGLLLTVLFYYISRRNASLFDEWYDALFPALSRTQAQHTYDDMMIGRDESSRTYNVIPFLDVLSFGSELQKRQALAKMTSNFHPHFAPAFKKALNDDSNVIRVQAATAISKIETHFMERLFKLATVNENYPHDPIVVMALAEHYDNYAYTGLLDADREQSNRQKALQYYQEYLELKPNDLDVRTRTGRILMRDKEYEKAVAWFRRCIDAGYNSPAISEWFSEALFNSGHYDELRSFTANNRPIIKSDHALADTLPVKEALTLWATSGGQL